MFVSYMLLAFGVSMDAFAVSLTNGLTARTIFRFRAVTLALFFAAFQVLMAALGALTGRWASTFLQAVDHWIAFALLAGIGLRMIHEARSSDRRTSVVCCIDPLNVCMLLALSVATSIDALAVGASLSFLGSAIFDPLVAIGFTTFFASLVGVYVGRSFGGLREQPFELLGGVILILIGGKVLADHLL